MFRPNVWETALDVSNWCECEGFDPDTLTCYLPTGCGRFTVVGKSGVDFEMPGGGKLLLEDLLLLLPFLEMPGGISSKPEIF